jgi:hypothetical protein
MDVPGPNEAPAKDAGKISLRMRDYLSGITIPGYSHCASEIKAEAPPSGQATGSTRLTAARALRYRGVMQQSFGTLRDPLRSRALASGLPLGD